ncbi:MAG TPA: hypothetical protein VHE55_04425 [Fimbriimonadaceae bacterium]|nr:hypothetical protein [Fimbriimonadaceae bacterium]
MDRMTVIGNGGAGKTTLSRRLAHEFDLPLHHMDRIIWQPNWGRTPDEAIRTEIERIIAQPRWLIDGLGPLWSIEMRLPHADRIILLDYPLEHCKAWAMQRVEEHRDKERPDAPEGCSFNGLEQTLLDLLDRVDREFMPRIRELVGGEEFRPKTLWLTSPDELGGLYTLLHESASNR